MREGYIQAFTAINAIKTFLGINAHKTISYCGIGVIKPTGL
jgi:hypothetical protein